MSHTHYIVFHYSLAVWFHSQQEALHNAPIQSPHGERYLHQLRILQHRAEPQHVKSSSAH